MFLFFTLLDTYYFLLLAILGFPVIISAVIKMTGQENLKKIYDCSIVSHLYCSYTTR